MPIKITNPVILKQIKGWFNTARYVYNQGVSHLRTNPKTTFYQLRDQLVTSKRANVKNLQIKDWELETPKNIRSESLRDLFKNYQSNFQKRKKAQIDKFKVHFKSKPVKHNRQIDSIVVNKEAIKIQDNQIIIFSRILKSSLGKIGKRNCRKWFGDDRRLLNSWNYKTDVRLVTDGRNFWLNFPIKTKNFRCPDNNKIIALDPGLRKFQTGYSDKWKRKLC